MQTATSRRANYKASQLALAPFTRQSALPRGLSSDELIIDNFAGGGGASTGIELALGRSVDIAINHDPDAIAMHSINHPFTTHYTKDVWHIDPVAICGGRPVGIAWFSPDCTHFARARGCKPVNKKIRGLAWVAVKYARKIRPRVILLENVPEFVDFGPVIPLVKDGVIQYHKDGTIKYVPDPKRKGQTFKRFVTTLKNLGYEVEWKVLNAASYGVPTSRRRFFLIARCDGQPIVWPEPVRAKSTSQEVRTGKLKPYRMAAECIDFSIPCPSIFTRKKPLADNTGNRVARGVLRFVINNPDPFVIEVPHGSLTNTDGSARARAIVLPFITRICHQGSKGANVHSVTEPLTTIVSKNEHVLIAPILVGVGGPQGAGNPQPADQPIGTIMPENHRALAVAFLTKFYGTATGSDLRQPMPSITAQAGGGHMGEVRAFLSKYDPTIHGDPALDPITVTIRGQRYVIVDIGLRMLTPRELAYAQFGWAPSLTPGGAERALAEDYIFPGTQANQISKIGNSVPPLMAAHLVAANVLPPRKAQRLLMAA